MGYCLDIILCGSVVIFELVAVIIGIMLIQLISYQVFGINPYKMLTNWFSRMDKKLSRMF